LVVLSDIEEDLIDALHQNEAKIDENLEHDERRGHNRQELEQIVDQNRRFKLVQLLELIHLVASIRYDRCDGEHADQHKQ